MKNVWRTIRILTVGLLVAALLSSCATDAHQFADTSASLIVSAGELQAYMDREDVVLIDMQSEEDYAASHLTGAVNLPSSEIVINVPVQNMLTSKKKIEKAMNACGVSNDSTVIVYDTDKMSASRLLWTLWMYGFENVRVVDGGFDAITAAGLPTTAEVPQAKEGSFSAGEPTGDWNVEMAQVLSQVEDPQEGVLLLDVRSDEEYQTEGKIPTAIMMNYLENFREDGTFRPKEITRINYLDAGINPENEIIIYCRTSFRAAPVFVQLYEAGYRNIKLYDGAFLEWTSVSSNPVEMPEGAAAPVQQDAS